MNPAWGDWIYSTSSLSHESHIFDILYLFSLPTLTPWRHGNGETLEQIRVRCQDTKVAYKKAEDSLEEMYSLINVSFTFTFTFFFFSIRFSSQPITQILNLNLTQDFILTILNLFVLELKLVTSSSLRLTKEEMDKLSYSNL